MSKFKLQRTQELTRTQHEDGKQDAWNGHAQVASQAMAVPEEYGPDAERQEVKRDEQEFRKAQQHVKKTTLGIRRKSINDGTRISKKMKRTIDERHSEVPRRGQGEPGKDWRTKNRKCIRCANARDDKRTGSPTENHSFTARKPIQWKNSRRSSCENKVEMQDITRKVQGHELRGQDKFGVEH